MMKEKINKCIYCGTEYGLTISDIIPDAITTAKCKNKNVCKECNNKTNRLFENKFASKFAFFRNQLGYTLRGSKEIVPFRANIFINKKPTLRGKPSIKNVRFTTYRDFVIKNCNFNSSGKIIGFKNYNPKYRNLIEPEIHYSCPINYRELFISRGTLKTVAKICYEWHCKQNGIYGKKQRYTRIINFITKRGINPVDIVSDELFESIMLENFSYIPGSHALIEFVSNGERFVVFTLFGAIWYRVRICFDFESEAKLQEMHQYSLDNEVREKTNNSINVECNLNDNTFNILENNFIPPYTIPVNHIRKEDARKWDFKMRQLLSGLYLRYPELNRLVTPIKSDESLLQNKRYYYELLFFREYRKIIALLLLYQISDKGYDENDSFMTNLNRWVTVLNEEPENIDSFLEKYIVGDVFTNFLLNVKQGIEIFDNIPPSI